MEESVVFTFPIQTYRNHSAVGHVISDRHGKDSFDLTEIMNNFGLKRGTVCQVVRFASHFSLKLYIQF